MDRLKPIFDTTRASVVICGHTHMQFDRNVGETRVVNAGGVGMPFGDLGAYCAVLEPGIELRHTAYDLVAAAKRIGVTSYPQVASYDVLRPPQEAEMLRMFEAVTVM